MPVARAWLGAALIGAQVVGIALSLAGYADHLGWAPIHEIVEYEVTVREGTRTLAHDEITRRYGLSEFMLDGDGERRIELNRIAHVLRSIAIVECEHDGAAEAEVRFRRNGGAETHWELRCD